MADSRIKGITIELDGETTGLQKALSDVTKQSVDIQKELRDVERLLKFDPSNTEAMAQKQQLLAAQIEATSTKLERLKAAEQQVNEQFEKGEIAEAQYRAFRREIEYTETSLDNFKKTLAKVDDVKPFKELKEDLKEIPESSEKAEESIESFGGGLVQLAAGAAAIGSIHDLIEKSLETSSVNTKLNISFNVSEESKASIREVINSIEAYGIDGETALEGVRKQWALNKDATDETNAAVIKAAATIVSTYGDIDFNELIQETNEMSKSMGLTNEQALALTNSLLSVGFPPDQLDIISEYGTQLKMAGYNAEEIQALFAAGVETGSWNIDNLMDGLKEGRIRVAEFGVGISDTIANLIQGTNISKDQLQSWGKEVAAGGEGGSRAMNEIAGALNGVDDQTKKNALGIQIFGTKYEDQGQKIIDTLINAKDKTYDMAASQNDLNGATEQLNADPAIAMKQAIADLTTAAAPLLLAIANIVSVIAQWTQQHPVIAAAMVGLISTIAILMGICMGFIPVITSITSAAAFFGVGVAAIAAPIGIAIAAIVALIAVGTYLSDNWDQIRAKAIEIWSFLSEWMAQTYTSIKENTAAAWASLTDSLFQTWESIKSNALEIWNSIGSFFTETIPAWVEFIAEWFLKLPNKIAYALGFALGTIIKWGIDAAEYINTNVPLWIESIGVFFSQLPEKIWVWLIEVLTKLGDWATKIINWIAATVPLWINSIVNYFATMPGAIWSWLVSCVDNMRTWGVNMLTEATQGAEKVFNGIVDTFKNLPQKMLDIGKNIVAGLKQGIQDSWDGMIGWMGGLIDDFIDGVKDALDIHSPSRVMKALGVFTGQGFEIGIASTIGNISKQAKALAAAAIPAIDSGSANFAVSGSGQVANAGINQTVNIYSPSALSPAETAKQNKRVLQELAFGL